MRSNDAPLEDSESRPRLLDTAVAGLGTLLAAALVSGVLDGALPAPARAEAAPPALAGGSGPARPSAPRLCLHGPGGELLDLAPAGQPCP